MQILKLKKKHMENYKNKLNLLINFIKKTNCRNIIKFFMELYMKK